MHSNATNQQLVARKTLDEPVITEVWEAQLNRKKVGPKFKTDLKALENVLEEMDQAQLEEASKVLAEKGQLEFKLPGKDQPLVVDKDDLAIERVTKKQTSNASPFSGLMMLTCKRTNTFQMSLSHPLELDELFTP